MSSEAESNIVRIRTSQIVWGVFMGMWIFAITGSIVWFGMVAMLRATGDLPR